METTSTRPRSALGVIRYMPADAAPFQFGIAASILDFVLRAYRTPKPPRWSGVIVIVVCFG
ncbi:hypothetical protein NDN16_12410, partial [Aureimonas altamirensis]|uniref:hypothetical protein n=1 Tax=Aureimonas altamirensis TaxID=370622 RepID=UPI002036B5CB